MRPSSVQKQNNVLFLVREWRGMDSHSRSRTGCSWCCFLDFPLLGRRVEFLLENGQAESSVTKPLPSWITTSWEASAHSPKLRCQWHCLMPGSMVWRALLRPLHATSCEQVKVGVIPYRLDSVLFSWRPQWASPVTRGNQNLTTTDFLWEKIPHLHTVLFCT